jgi:integrase/recombinase XerD
MQRAGIRGAPHACRHFYGTQVLALANGDLRVAQELLRHASPKTTAIYTLVDDTKRRSALMGLPS